MKKYILLSVFAVAAMVVSCEKNPSKGEEDLSGKGLSIKASAAVDWAAGSEILVSCDGEVYSFTTAQGGNPAVFTSEDGLTVGKVGINPVTAYYGCTQFGAFTLPQNQIIQGGKSQTRLPMYAYSAAGVNGSELALNFTPAASLLEVSLSPVDATISRVELLPVEETALSGNVAGAATVNAVTGKVTPSGDIKSVSANFQGGVSAKSGLSFTLPVGWFSVTGGMKLVLTYNETSSYEEIIWADGNFASYDGSADSKGFKSLKAEVEMVIGARDYYVAPDGKASSKGIRASDPATLDYALTTADEGSVIHLAAGTYKPTRALSGDESGNDAYKTFEIARGLTLVGEGADKTILDADGAFHAVCVTAPAAQKVVVKNLAITGGDTSKADTDGKVTSPVNEANYADNYGAGLYAVGCELELDGVTLEGNKGVNAVGGYLNGVKASLKNVKVSGNTSSGNGCGLWVAASEITMDGCEVSGNVGGGVAAGLYLYAAKEASLTATVRNSLFTGNETTNNNSAVYVRGADATAKVTASFEGCTIRGNKGTMGAGFGVTYAKADFVSCLIENNTASGNGGNLVYPGADVTVKDCIFRGNSATMAPCIYEYTNADAVSLIISGSEFSANKATTSRGGAVYARAAAASATLHVANSTFFDNEAPHYGSAIALYGTAAFPVTAHIYSSTITGNRSTGTTANRGGAIGLETAGLTAHIYNSIISGNVWEAQSADADLFVGNTASKAHVYKSIVGSKVYDADGAVVTEAPAFVPGTMLTKKTAEGKTSVWSLSGDNNPAKTYGYDAAGLKALGGAFGADILGVDQWGNTRSGAVMGAYIQ